MSGILGLGGTVSAQGVSSAIGDFGGAVSDLMAVGGMQQEATAFGQAAALEEQNKQIALESGAIQQMQQQRQELKVVGAGQADVAGNGLAASGNALDVYRNSMAQGALASQLTGVQTQVNANSYEAQAGAYRGEQQAAESAAKAKQAGGIMSAIGGVAAIGMML